MNGQFYEVFKEELLKDEKILWSGQPETSVLFTSADIFLVPFSLLWVVLQFSGNLERYLCNKSRGKERRNYHFSSVRNTFCVDRVIFYFREICLEELQEKKNLLCSNRQAGYRFNQTYE